MIRLKMKNCNMMLTKKLLKHQLHHQVKLENMNYLEGKKTLSSDQGRVIEQAKFT